MIKAEIIGNLGGDAVLKEFGGRTYVSLSVGVNKSVKDTSGNKIEKTVWISVLWSSDGGSLLQYLKKGTKIFVRGDLDVKEYTDAQGTVRFSINVTARELELCGNSTSKTE